MDAQIKLAILAIVIIIPLSSVGVWASDQPSFLQAKNENLIVLTTFYPLYEFSNNVGGTAVDVFLLIPSGVEPHEWEPSIREIQRIQNADIIVINGLGFEHWVNEIDFTSSDVLIINTSENIIHEDVLFHNTKENILEKQNSESNPHIWLNPIMAKIQVQNIADGFSLADPANEKTYKENAEIYNSKLDLLDSKIKKELANCNSDFITFHDAFSYFAKQYALTQHTILKSTDHHTEPTSKRLEEVISLAKNLEIKVIFSEEISNAKTSQVIANEIGGMVLNLSALEVLDNGDDYFEKMETNLIKLKEALCT